MKEAIKPLFLLDDEQLYGAKKDVVDSRWGVTPRQIMRYVGVDTLMYNLDPLIYGIGQNFYN